MKNAFIFLFAMSLFLMTNSANTFAQQSDYRPLSREEPEPSLSDLSFWDRVYFGGFGGAAFGTITMIEVAPLMGYMFTERFSAGINPVYMYFSDRRFDFSTSIFGPRFFARQFISPTLFIQGEIESMRRDYFTANNEFRRDWVDGAMLGGGINQMIGRRSGISFMVLYNVLHDDFRSPYPSPWILRVGLML
ncbi:MAG: hypothetical protein LAT68_08270 [Cyclobacteriaceae bacterium]|nr:hypothetical protein [Cyclobacteriaceae bacterium]MCH8516310.1 hypothetical protein [Cyclobacteriaceae bacterium]